MATIGMTFCSLYEAIVAIQLTSSIVACICSNYFHVDKKRYEFGRCRELKCISSGIGLLIVFVLDVLQLWLSVSVALSWVMTSDYFFPTPNLPIRGSGALSQYAINVGPVLLTWLLRWVKSNVEHVIGKRLIAAQRYEKEVQRQHRREARKQAREMMTEEEKEARRVARMARKAEIDESDDKYTPGSSTNGSQEFDSNLNVDDVSNKEIRKPEAQDGTNRDGMSQSAAANSAETKRVEMTQKNERPSSYVDFDALD